MGIQERSGAGGIADRTVSDWLSSLIHAMAVPVYLTDPKGRILDYNASAAALWGRAPDLGESDAHFCGALRASWPDGTPLAPEDRPVAETLRTGKPVYRRRLVIERADGSRSTVLANASPIHGVGGVLAGATNCMIEVTEQERTEAELRESRERFRQLAESIEEVFWLADWDAQRVLYVSPAYETIWGRPVSGLYADLQDWLKAIKPKDRDRVAEALFRDAPRGTYEQEYRIQRPDGEQRWIHDRGFPIHDERGHMHRVAGIAQDVTRRKRAEQQLRAHEKQLAHISRLSLMGEMASGLGHELNQPLAAIHLYASGALRRLGGTSSEHESLREPLQQIERQARRAGDIVKSLREFVRGGGYERVEVQLNELVREALSLARRDLQDAGVELDEQFAGALPPLLVGKIEIQQVVLNLLRNAVEAMDDNKGDEPRQITVITSQPDPDHAQITVRDTGPGVTDDQFARLFTPFYTTKPSGMGMGLNICETIVQRHGGRLWGERNVERGLSIHLRLPIKRADRDAGGP